jgi:Protein of unknown function (DUF1592)/Protein of unknown function (DUF1588)/Protein of unknown function (DUF1595)/Protein of unknown function (DUF1587)/Protein of unknown function (DUF1585)
MKAPKIWLLSLLALASCTGAVTGESGPGVGAGVATGSGLTPKGGSTSTSSTTSAPAGLDAGRSVMRRLTRFEYNNTVRDLLGTMARPADAFPADEVSEGFASIGEYLAFSPLHAEQMEAASAQLIDELFARPPSDPARSLTLSCTLEPGAEASCARKILETFARRAYRRVPEAAEIDALMTLVDSARAGETYETGLKAALQAVLLSPHFIYRVERDKQQPSAERPATDDELATRLSYFLWSSLPDDALFEAAASKRLLGDGAELSRQLQRMLADPKASALVTNFGAQWLKLGRLANPLGVDATAFPTYDDQLRVSAAQETELFFDAMLRNNLPLASLLTADFTFADARLGQHYGLSVSGSDLLRTSLAGTPRRGILTQASVLLGTSLPTRTSPVKRGVWVLEQLLCVDPPPPPANVTIPPLATPAAGATLRQTLEAHRQNPTCAGCHAVMDPLGFGLENFDAIGRYRDSENGVVVDASGVYADGQKFVGAGELATLVAADKRFASCVTQQLLTYAVGRSFRTADGAAYAAALTDGALAAGQGQWLSWIRNIATSVAFRTRSGDTP